MLEELTIKDFALIESDYLEFSDGLTVLSGETGAGKSILIGALSFLLGGKADEITVAYYGIGLRHSELLSPCCDMVFLLSGAAVNIVLCLIGISKEINFSLALINLLPLYPLDGGRAFKVLLNSAFSLNVSDSIMTVASFVFTSLILVCSIVLRNISLALISLYIVYYSINFKRFI